jgi:glycosyltransferase involved in cell wall biosynthesis
LSGCAVMVVPLRYGGGTRIKILEAFAMEKAVVSTSLGCEGIEVHSGEEILIADTPEFFADSVVEVLTDSNLREKLGKNGRKLVQEKYNWEKISQKLEGIYQRTIKP